MSRDDVLTSANRYRTAASPQALASLLTVECLLCSPSRPSLANSASPGTMYQGPPFAITLWCHHVGFLLTAKPPSFSPSRPSLATPACPKTTYQRPAIAIIPRRHWCFLDTVNVDYCRLARHCMCVKTTYRSPPIAIYRGNAYRNSHASRQRIDFP
ncbi:hypothetical protein B0H34DRAFT_539579 [Crassisporium funariophilum]|nr:hypothetical protein B0H34DRAFT_539271 [Crassisporium funariophilum]KAF8154839.1 hypothetical protein B0H34DRAFT_539579 [Crassisporium funariophilum]